MGYKIQYSPEDTIRYPTVGRGQKRRRGRWIGPVLFLLAVLWMSVNGIPDFLIPGDPQITKAAAVTMLHEMQAGTSVSDAVTAFCTEIINGAQA